MHRFKLTIYLILFLSSARLGAQESTCFTIYFKQGSSVIELDYMNNHEVIHTLRQVVPVAIANDSSAIKVKLQATASPEGRFLDNKKLALERYESIERFLYTHFPSLTNRVHCTQLPDIGWEELVALVRKEEHVPHRHKIIEIITTLPNYVFDANKQIVTGRKMELMALDGGRVWFWLEERLFEKLRSASVELVYPAIVGEKQPLLEPLQPMTDGREMTPVVTEITPFTNVDSLKVAAEGLTPAATESINELLSATPPKRTVVKPLFAVKTNLLYDALLVPGLELELPLATRWSVAAEVLFPWWVADNGKADSKRNRLQLHNVNVEGKYWLGNRKEKPLLTGWFVGLYTGIGIYDVEYQAEGIQGKFMVGGASAGYSHSIDEKGHLRMEYALGVGYFQSDYNKYKAHYHPHGEGGEWHPIREARKRHQWLGPTKAKVSLVWMLHYKTTKGGKL
ncbi:MAG: DUF3575 domain-containing protein [Phocaeicola sp.]